MSYQHRIENESLRHKLTAITRKLEEAELALSKIKPIELPSVQVDNPFDGFYYRCDEVVAAILAAGCEVKE